MKKLLILYKHISEKNIMKRLYRNKKESKIAGVCLGISDYFKVDPVIIRLIFLITFFCGVGPIAYIICWIIMPIKEN